MRVGEAGMGQRCRSCDSGLTAIGMYRGVVRPGSLCSMSCCYYL